MGLISRVSSRTYSFFQKALKKPHKNPLKMAEVARALQSQNIWFARNQYLDAEVKLAQFRLGVDPKEAAAAPKTQAKKESKPQSKAAKMVSDLKNDLQSSQSDNELSKMLDRVVALEKENAEIKESLLKALERLEILEKQGAFTPEAAAPAAAPAKAAAKAEEEDEDDDDDFFASSDDEDGDAKKAAEELKAKRVAEYNARKAAKEEKKGKVIAKSSITFDVKPWDDETDLDALCKKIKDIQMDGLLWGSSAKKPLAYGIFKLSITCVVEDDKVGSDDLTEKIEAFEDEVQSVDIAAFQKI